MNLFKKALVASAIAGVCATTQAADLTDATVKQSIQGVEIGNAALDSSIRVIVREQLEAGDRITIKLGAGITGVTTAAAGAAAVANQLVFEYGSGTYTMTHISTTANADGTTDVILEVETGDPIAKDSSFELHVDSSNFVTAKASQATATYSAISGLDSSPKDTSGDNVGLFYVAADQYGSAVKTKLNGVIEREAQVTFVSGFAGADVDTDTLVITLSDNQALGGAANGANVQATVTVFGDFSSATIAGAGTSTSADDVLAGFAIAADKSSMSFTVTDTVAADGIAGDVTLTLDNATGTIKASEFTATVSVDADTTDGTNTAQTTLDKADAGEWEVDATIVTIPYLPVGFEGTSSSVHFSNTSSSTVDVIVSAVSTVDAEGNSVKYDAVDLGMDLPANSVTKISQGMLKTLFGIEGSAKLSVTFNLDADNDDVTAYAFTTDDTGRTEISNTAQKGIK